jgi:triacylglycerol lipase
MPLALARPDAAAAAPRPPVLLIHGMKEDARKMEPLARYLRAHGREVYTTSLRPSLGQVGLDELAGQLDTYVRETFAPGERFDLVGFSMGGLVSRYYVQRLGGLERVHRFVTISSPHQGSVLAWLIPNPGARQMRPGSAFLRDLDRDADQLQRVGFTSLWTPLDLIIVPAHNSIVPGADSRRLWCLGHPLMVFQPSCKEAVRQALE